MSEYTVKTGIDSFVDADRPNAGHADWRRMWVSSNQFAHIWIRVPAVDGDTIQVARLRVTVMRDFTGTATLQVRRIRESWKARTLDWNNRPQISGISDEVTVTDPVAGDVIEFDLTSSIANVTEGVAYYGYRIESDSADTLVLWSFDGDAGPELYVQSGAAPAQPSMLTPADGVIGKAKWVCSADFTDHIGDTDLAAMQVQIDAAADGAAPDFDSGEVAVDAPQLDLADTTYAGLASGATTQWRTRLKDGSGLWSPWSDWVSVTYKPKGTVTITNPTGGTVGTPTPEITATLTGAAAEDFRVTVTDADDRAAIRYDSWRRAVPASGVALELPEKWDGRRVLIDDSDYQVRVRVWDTEDRVASVGDPTYSEAWITFAMEDDATQTPPDSLTADMPVSKKPAVTLTWHRAVQPDQFVITRDGRIVKFVDAADVVQGDGVTYSWTDVGVTGYRAQTWQVRAVTSGKRSAPAQVVFTPTPEGVWLMTEDDTRQVQLFEDASIDQLTNTDQAGSYDVIGRRYSTRVVTALSGRAARGMEFVIMDDPEGYRTWEQYEANMLAIKANPLDEYRYYAGGDNLLVRISNVTVTERSDSMPDQVRRIVRFDLEQVGDFEYGGRV